MWTEYPVLGWLVSSQWIEVRLLPSDAGKLCRQAIDIFSLGQSKTFRSEILGLWCWFDLCYLHASKSSSHFQFGPCVWSSFCKTALCWWAPFWSSRNWAAAISEQALPRLWQVCFAIWSSLCLAGDMCRAAQPQEILVCTLHRHFVRLETCVNGKLQFSIPNSIVDLRLSFLAISVECMLAFWIYSVTRTIALHGHCNWREGLCWDSSHILSLGHTTKMGHEMSHYFIHFDGHVVITKTKINASVFLPTKYHSRHHLVKRSWNCDAKNASCLQYAKWTCRSTHYLSYRQDLSVF